MRFFYFTLFFKLFLYALLNQRLILCQTLLVADAGANAFYWLKIG